MGRVTFSTENKKATTNYDYPKLKLKSGEKARILILEDPVVEYVHTLRKPQIVNGKPIMETKKRKDDTEYQDYKMDFVSRPICLGDEGILDDKGSDEKNCPMCALAKSDPDMTSAPQRRYAMHVVKYKTKPGSTDVQTPFGVDVVVWSFTDRIFGAIVDFKNDWDDLRKHDLVLGPCTNETFQQFDMNVQPKAAWLQSDADRLLTAESFKNNQIDDLAIACGSKKERKWIDEDIAKIREAWTVVSGAPAEAANDAAISASLDKDLNSLLDEPAKTEAPAAAASSTDDLLSDLGASPDSFPETAEKGSDEKAAEPETPAPATSSDALDDLLADL
jgi:hypothetical protein